MMPAGRELDLLIAERVFGRYPGDGFLGQMIGGHYVEGIPHYSTDISAAWEVVGKMQSNDWSFILDNMKDFLGNWQAHFEKDRMVYTAEADSAPHATCLAALKVMEGNQYQSR